MGNVNPFGGVNLAAAANGNVHLLRALQAMQDQFDLVNGGPVLASTSLVSTTNVVAPPPASPFTVVGSEGKFIIDITPPGSIVQPSPLQRILAGSFNTRNAPVNYQLRCADDEGITTNVITYSPQTAVHIEILMPNSFKFWQMRSQYTNLSAWTSWQPFTDPSVCGPIQVWSGLITSTATSLVNQGSSYTGSSPLTQSGSSTRILVAGTTWHAGSQTLIYLGSSVDPGAYGLYYVYADDPARQGGAVVYEATSDVSQLVALDGRLYFGSITTATGGGGSGGGGGGGACVSGPTDITMWDGSKQPQVELWRKDRVRGIDGEIDNIVDIEMFAGIPCFINEFDNGILTHPFSSRHPLKYSGGGFGLNFDLLVGETFVTEKGVARLNRKLYAGPQTVYAMTLGRSFTFWADGVGSHNSRFQGK